MEKHKIFLIFALFLLGCQPIQPLNKGNIIVGITDFHLGSIDSLNVMINAIELQNTNGQKFAIAINKQFDLILLSNQDILGELGNITVTEGTYNLLVLYIANVQIKRGDNIEVVILPSNSLKIPISLNVGEDKTSAIVLDFKAEESLHITGNNKIIMTPVIHLQEKEDVEVKKSSKGLAFGRAVSERAKTMGTDIKGIVAENKKVTKEDIDKIVIDTVGKIREIPKPNQR